MFNPPRPTVTHEMKLQAARRVVAEMDTNEDCDELAEAIARHGGLTGDGFELGKDLERDGYLVDFQMTEELDCFSSTLRRILGEAESAWATEHNIQPPYPVGTETTEGVIAGISQHDAACYLIKPYGQDDATSGNRRIVVKFEKVKLKESAAA